MEIQDFINHVVDGNALEAKNTLNNLLSAKSFEALDMRKQELAKTIFGGQEIEQETENQNSEEQ